ncbi:Hsp70 family protein [Hamadaea sp. NPDC051192]|uniref:Hsp70 family protein n=1 Tax=Hamadaea sp. NPDC051192 TaxID=3154940 RepID=UPI003429AAEA
MAIDFGTSRTVAVAALGNRRIPIGPSSSPSGTPAKSALTVMTSDDAAVDAVAQILSDIREQARRTVGEPTEAVLTAPAAWGPRRKELLRRAAVHAGLPNPRVVADPIAAAAYAATIAPVATGETVLVCDIGAGFTEVTVVQRDATGWTQLATQPVPAATGRHLQTELAKIAAQTLTDLPPGVLADSIHTALLATAPGQRAVVVPPEPHPPVVLTAEQIDIVAEPMRRDLATAIRATIDAADIDPDTMTAAIVLGGPAATLQAGHLIAERCGITPIGPQDPIHAVALGALALTHHTPDQAEQPHMSQDARTIAWRKLLRPPHIIGTALLAAAGGLVVYQEIQRLHAVSDIYRGVDYVKLAIFFQGPTFAAAGLMLTLAAIAIGAYLATALQLDDQDNRTPGQRGGLAGRALAFSAVVGLAVAGLFGLLTETLLGFVTGITPNFVLATLAASFLPAVLCIAAGLIAPLVPRLRGQAWARHLHPPVGAALLAAAGISGMIQRDLHLAFLPESLRYIALYEPIARIGAGLLGVAVALTLIRHGPARLILAVILGAGFAIVYGFQAVSAMTMIYLLAISVWWIRQTVRIVVDGHPSSLWVKIRASLTQSPTSPEPEVGK